MKINTSIPSVTANDAAGRAKPAAAGNRKAAAAGDQVELSAMAARLQDAGTPVVDAARVAEIKQAISEGKFQINPERIADGLLESVREMLARQQG
ncbi:MAG: flagellar biosynthesis anti-sigma factor FlgM [Rhodocyclales bacterium]|nr:flagellar biosynthesis anti-sigma factor FlgM [Rhodocyclales bacterium]